MESFDSILPSRLLNQGYRITMDKERFYLWYGDGDERELVTTTGITAIGGVLREAGWRHAFYRNLKAELDQTKGGSE